MCSVSYPRSDMISDMFFMKVLFPVPGPPFSTKILLASLWHMIWSNLLKKPFEVLPPENMFLVFPFRIGSPPAGHLVYNMPCEAY